MILGRLEALPDMQRVLVIISELIKKHPSFESLINLEEIEAEMLSFKEKYDRQIKVSQPFKRRILNTLMAK